MAPHHCDACGNSADGDTKLSICTGCRLVCYCSKSCQSKMWQTHRAFCKTAKKEAEHRLGEICEAARDGDQHELRRLLRAHPAAINMRYAPPCDPHLKRMGLTPLTNTALGFASAGAGQLGSVRILLEHGARIDIGDEDYDQLPLHRACEGGHLGIVMLLMERGSDVLKPDRMGQTPLHFAAEAGHVSLVKYLLQNGARPCLTVSYRGKTPKMWALMGGHVECAELL